MAAWIETWRTCKYSLQVEVAAHGALAMTTPGDTTMATLAEVKQVTKGFAARIAR
jgi:2-dehydro-3-deoxygluconokinase